MVDNALKARMGQKVQLQVLPDELSVSLEESSQLPQQKIIICLTGTPHATRLFRSSRKLLLHEGMRLRDPFFL